MLSLGPQQPLQRLLAIGAHSDDIEIGCAGTVMRLLRHNPGIEVWWMVLSAHGDRRQEAQSSAEAMLSTVTRHSIVIHSFRDGFLPYEGAAVKEQFEHVKAHFQPDLILTHSGHDAHQDHRIVSELTWNTFRDHLILEFEIPKYDGDFGSPNFFVPLEEELVEKKIEHLSRSFPSQRAKRWFGSDLFRSVLRLRGMECNAPSLYAEAFYSRKVVV